jgi:hypothetical protein
VRVLGKQDRMGEVELGCFESEIRGVKLVVCMLIAEKNIIENEYRRIDMEIYDLFPRRFGNVSFR